MTRVRTKSLHKLPADLEERRRSTLAQRERYEAGLRDRGCVWRSTLAGYSWDLGCLAIAGAGDGDAEAALAFQAAGRYAGEAFVTPCPNGALAAEFVSLLRIATAFGAREHLEAGARVSESLYLSAGIVAPPEFYLVLRAHQAWLRADDDAVLRLTAEVLSAPNVEPRQSAFAAALRGIVHRDSEAFRRALDDGIVSHRKWARRWPIAFVVSDAGMALCRMARTAGMGVEDQMYLPTRLLPSHPIR